MFPWYDGYTQLCVLPNIALCTSTEADFMNWLTEALPGIRFRYAEQIAALPKGNADQLFWVHKDDIGKFADERLKFGIIWWEDIVRNLSNVKYPVDILRKYPYTWGRMEDK